MKGMLVDVLRSSGDCTNGGLSSRHNTLLLVGPGVAHVFDESERNPTIHLIYEHDQWKAVVLHPEGRRPMFGGNFVYSSDSRFQKINKYPIPIHDRFE